MKWLRWFELTEPGYYYYYSYDGKGGGFNCCGELKLLMDNNNKLKLLSHDDKLLDIEELSTHLLFCPSPDISEECRQWFRNDYIIKDIIE